MSRSAKTWPFPQAPSEAIAAMTPKTTAIANAYLKSGADLSAYQAAVAITAGAAGFTTNSLFVTRSILDHWQLAAASTNGHPRRTAKV